VIRKRRGPKVYRNVFLEEGNQDEDVFLGSDEYFLKRFFRSATTGLVHENWRIRELHHQCLEGTIIMPVLQIIRFLKKNDDPRFF